MRALRIERLERRDLLSGDALTIEITMLNHVTGANFAYPGSAFEGDEAIATDKTPLRPGETATAANYTSYPKGINGLVIDVHEIPDEAEVYTTDFVFGWGNSNFYTTWDLAPDPSDIVIGEDEGIDGADRVRITWPDYTIVDQWLSVQLLPDKFDLQAHFDFEPAAAEPFFFGNLRGENTGDFQVNYDDVFDVIWPSLFTSDPIGVDHPADINRDKQIDYADKDAVWPHLFGERLAAITPSPVDPDMQARAALSVVIGQIQARQRVEERERFDEFAGLVSIDN